MDTQIVKDNLANQVIRRKVAEFHPDAANTLRTIIKTESARKRSQARNR